MIAAVVREVVVPSSAEEAFHRFTDEIGKWWPTHTHSIHQADCAGVVLEQGVGGRLYEVSPRATVLWGTVRTWDPPRTVALSWLFIHTSFATHYAFDYYGAREDGAGKRGGLDIPGGAEPDFWDVWCFSIVIGLTFATADVNITSGSIRRIATAWKSCPAR